MSHLNTSLPQRIEKMAVRRIEWDTEVIRTDGGNEVRNSRWSAPLRSYEISMPIMDADDADYLATLQLFEDAEGSLNSFNFNDFTDDTDATIVPVRFDTPLQITAVMRGKFHIDTFTLVEVRSENS